MSRFASKFGVDFGHIAILFALLSCHSIKVVEQVRPRENGILVTIDDDWRHYEVRVTRRVVGRISPLRRRARDNVRSFLPCSQRSAKIDLMNTRCVRVRGELKRTSGLMSPPKTTSLAPISLDDFLWVPDGVSMPPIEFRVPQGYQTYLPWQRETQGWRVPENVHFSKTFVAFSKIEPQFVDVGHTRVAVFAAELSLSPLEIEEWMNAALGAFEHMAGGQPRHYLQLFLYRAGEGNDSVAFGLTHRGAVPTISLFVRGNASLKKLKPHWVLVHELSHLLHAPVQRKSMWVSEGIATYYQEVLRVRAGLSSEEEAIASFRKGLERAEASLVTGENIEEARGNYARIYWQGALFALLADAELRKKGSSLEEALMLHRQQCEVAQKVHSAKSFVDELGLSALHQRFLEDEGIPSHKELRELLLPLFEMPKKKLKI